MKISLQKVSNEICKKFSSKARSYMLTYQHLVILELENKINHDTCCLELNNKLHETYRSHRDTNIIERIFIQKVTENVLQLSKLYFHH